MVVYENMVDQSERLVIIIEKSYEVLYSGAHSSLPKAIFRLPVEGWKSFTSGHDWSRLNYHTEQHALIDREKEMGIYRKYVRLKYYGEKMRKLKINVTTEIYISPV